MTRAKAVAGADYVVLVADVYGKGRQPANAGEAGKLAGGLRASDFRKVYGFSLFREWSY